MILCPNCQYQELTGALFCSKCGVQLLNPGDLNTQNIDTSGMDGSLVTRSPTDSSSAAPIRMNSWISLHILESGQILSLADHPEFTLGRGSEGQPIMPDVDLSPYQAYDCGVSRLHAILRRLNDRVGIIDIGSSNGTFVNGKRLEGNVEYPLTHGDIITLGKLKIQVLLNNK
jgi:hypothetical protein